MNKLAIDLTERTLATFGEAFCGTLLLSLASAPAIPSLSLLEKAAAAGVIAALALVKGLASAFLGNKNSAAALPASVDPTATGAVVSARPATSFVPPPPGYPEGTLTEGQRQGRQHDVGPVA